MQSRKKLEKRLTFCIQNDRSAPPPPPPAQTFGKCPKSATMEKYQFKSGFSLTNACMFTIFNVKLLKYFNSYHWKYF